MAELSTLPGVGGTTAVMPVAAERGTGPSANSTSFQALLERLQRLAAAPKDVPAVATADDLGEAMREAEKTFTTAMDLRRQLEEAFRRHSS